MRTEEQRQARIRRWCGIHDKRTVERVRYVDECGNKVVRTTVRNIGTNYRERSFLGFRWLQKIE